MAAELRLGVSFDLVYFRQQLQKLGRIASSEFTARIKIKLDRKVVDSELNNLQRAIKRRKYNIELNITGGLRKQTFDDLQARLDALSARKKVEIPVSIKNAATAKDVNDTVVGIKARIAQNQTVKQGDGKIRINTSIKPSITNADVADFRRVVQAKLSGISVKVKADIQGGFASGPTGLAGLQEYMRTQGLSGGNVPGAAQTGRRTQFEAAVAQASNRELQDMMRRAKVQGRSSIRSSAAMRERLMQLDDAAMESVLGNLQMNMNDPRRVKRGFLDQVARAVFWMAGVDPEYLKRQAAQRRALPGVDFPATVPPSNVSIGPSGTGRALPAGAIPGALPGTAFGARGFLPPQLGQDLQNILRNAAFTFVDSLNARIRQVNVREIGRQALPPSMIRGLLPSAVGRTPATYGGPADRGSFIQNHIAQAYARSALRGASVMAESPQGFALKAEEVALPDLIGLLLSQREVERWFFPRKAACSALVVAADGEVVVALVVSGRILVATLAVVLLVAVVVSPGKLLASLAMQPSKCCCLARLTRHLLPSLHCLATLRMPRQVCSRSATS